MFYELILLSSLDLDEQALGIKGKMLAKKNYAEKVLMKKTSVFYFYFICASVLFNFLKIELYYNMYSYISSLILRRIYCSSWLVNQVSKTKFARNDVLLIFHEQLASCNRAVNFPVHVFRKEKLLTKLCYALDLSVLASSLTISRSSFCFLMFRGWFSIFSLFV